MGFLAALPAIIGGIQAGGSILSGILGGNASKAASKAYIDALKQAQSFLTGQEQQGLGNYQPYLDAGKGATTTLASLLGTPGQGLLTPWTQTFTAPTAEQAAQTPGYQFQLQQGASALQNSAAARGGLLSGRTLADLNTYAQGLASTNYQNVFNNSLTQYQSAYNTFLNNQNNTYGRLLGLSNLGLEGAQGAGNLIQGIGGDIASLYTAQGAAAAQGILGANNAYSSIIPGIGNAATTYLGLSSLNPFGGSTTAMGGPGSIPTSSLPNFSGLPLNPTPPAPVVPGLGGH